MMMNYNEKGQAVAPTSHPFGVEAFAQIQDTQIRWLGFGGVMINTRGTILLLDPLLTCFDMPVMIENPIDTKQIPHVDATLITHIDNDHFSRSTCKQLVAVCDGFHGTSCVYEEMTKEGIAGIPHAIGDQFQVKDASITLTPACHNWRKDIEKYQYRTWNMEDDCGYWIETKDGTIWLPGDSKLLDEHLHMPQPDVILFDFSDNEWHITLAGAIQLANTYPDAELLCIHWGSVDAPEMTPFNGDPSVLEKSILNPERLHAIAAGEVMTLSKGAKK